jgi:hypothetical protein
MGDTVVVIPEEWLSLNNTKDGMVLPRVVPLEWTFGGFRANGTWKEFFERRICGHVRDADNSVVGGGIE